MWEVKNFNSEAKAREWIANNSYRYQCQLIFTHNGYGVEYKKLRKVL